MRTFPETAAPGPAARAVPAILPSCEVVLRTLLDETPGVLGAVMARADGRTTAQAFREGHKAAAAEIAAVSSSLLALCESFGRKTLRSGARYSRIVTERGCIVIVRVPASKSKQALCAWTGNDANFATTLRFALDTADQLAQLPDDEPRRETAT